MADPSALYGGYLKASRYGRIKDADLNRVLTPYKMSLKGIRSQPYRGFSDVDYRRMATRAVVKKYLLGKAQKAAPGNYTSMSIAALQKYIQGKK